MSKDERIIAEMREPRYWEIRWLKLRIEVLEQQLRERGSL